MAPRKKAEDAADLEITIVAKQRVTYCIRGIEPLICHRMNEKAKQQLLLPGAKLTTAERAMNEKHNPPEEYRKAVYRRDGDRVETRLTFPVDAFKAALCTAALDVPGARKAQYGRLVSVVGERIPLFGVPQLIMSVVRNSDAGHTPDIRTRAILPRWALSLSLTYASSLLKLNSVTALLGTAGFTVGVGDYRQEKGKGNKGQYVICEEDDPEYLDIIASGGREAQDEALASPVCYDIETEEMLSWYVQESHRRRNEPKPAPKGKGKRQGNGGIALEATAL
jgi:hypothetical protein